MTMVRRRRDAVVASTGDHLWNRADGLAADPLVAARREAHLWVGVLEAAVALQARQLGQLDIRIRRVHRASRRRQQ